MSDASGQMSPLDFIIMGIIEGKTEFGPKSIGVADLFRAINDETDGEIPHQTINETLRILEFKGLIIRNNAGGYAAVDRDAFAEAAGIGDVIEEFNNIINSADDESD